MAERAGFASTLIRVAPRPVFAALAPWGPPDPRDRPGRPGSPFGPPWPDVALASGRRAVPYLRAIKRWSGGRVFTVFLKDPRTGPGAADLIWSPSYDRLRGPNVITSLTSPHRLSPAALAAARATPHPTLDALPGPRVAVLVGGTSRHGVFTVEDGHRLAADLARLADTASLMITPSRRTPLGTRDDLARLSTRPGIVLWDGAGANPYPAMLARADAVVVTADSINMVSEALALGRPVLLFEPAAPATGRLRAFHEGLKRLPSVHPFRGELEGVGSHPLDVTPRVAGAVLDGLARHRAAFA